MPRIFIPNLKQPYLYALPLIPGVNFICLYIHNQLLPWLYFVLVTGYYLLHCEIQKKNRIDYTAGAKYFCFPEKYSPGFYWRWFSFAYLPLLFSLYYLDFALLLTGFFLISITIIFIYKEKLFKIS